MYPVSGTEGSNPSLSVRRGGRPGPARASAAVLVLLAVAGCANRTLTIDSEPPGARVILNREEIGETPVTKRFRYGGINEILVIPAPAGPDGQPYKPALVYHDTWRFSLDFPIVDGLAELAGTEDHQSVRVRLEPNELPALANDERTRAGVLTALRERAQVLRSLALDRFIQAPPGAPAGRPNPDGK